VERTPQESAKPSRPQDIDRGVKLAYASLLFGIVAEVVDFRHVLAMNSATDNLTTFVFAYGIPLFLILRVSSGRNWARIVLLLMFLVGLGLYAMFFPHDTLKRNPMMVFVTFVPTLLQGAALFFWFKRSSGAWFKGGVTTA
jgi:hypothetical protein